MGKSKAQAGLRVISLVNSSRLPKPFGDFGDDLVVYVQNDGIAGRLDPQHRFGE